MSKTKNVQVKQGRKPFEKLNPIKMKPKPPKKKGVKEADRKVRQSISSGELIKVKSVCRMEGLGFFKSPVEVIVVVGCGCWWSFFFLFVWPCQYYYL